MPEENFNTDALAEAVARGLEKAMGNANIQEVISNMVNEGGKRSGGGQTGGSVGTEGQIRQAREAYAKRQEAAANPNDIQSRVDQTNAARQSRGFLGNVAAGISGDNPQKTVFDKPYQVIPPNFGDFMGSPSFQSYFQMMANRNFEKMGNASNAAELLKAERGVRRNAFMANEVVPTAQAAQRYGGAAYRMMQTQSDLGATQLGGAAVGGNLQLGPFGFRMPFNNAFTKGLGIKFHQMGQAMGAGINMEQMQEIDNTLMGMGFNFDNPRFSRGERALEELTKFNPTINTKMAAQQMEYTMRYGTTQQLTQLNKAIEGLGLTAATTGFSFEELQAQMLEYTSQAEKMGGSSVNAAQNSAYLSRTLPGLNPTQVQNTLHSNPMGMQAAMSAGYMPYQVGAMSHTEQRKAFEGSIDQAWQSLTGKTLAQTDKAYLDSKEGQLMLGSLQGLYFPDIDYDQLKNLVGNYNARQQSDKAIGKYFQIDPKTGNIKTNKQGHAETTGALKGLIKKTSWSTPGRAGIGRGEQGTYMERADFDAMMRESGIRGNAANSIWKSITGQDSKDDSGRYTKRFHKNWQDNLREGIDNYRTGSAGAPAGDWNKVVKAAEDMTKGLTNLKNNQSSGAYTNGSNPKD